MYNVCTCVSSPKLEIINTPLAPTWSVCPSVRKSVGTTFGFPFCQRLLTKLRDAIAVAAMVADMVADTVADIAAHKKQTKHKQTKKLADVESIMVADMQVDKVADIIKTMCIKTEMLKNKVYWAKVV